MSLKYVLIGGALWLGMLANLSWGQSLEEFNRDEPADSREAVAQPRPELSTVVDLIIEKTNQFRHEEGREPVKTDPRLMDTAKDFAQFMARTNQYGHTADGKRPSQRAADHGYDYCIVAENIAYQYRSAGFATEPLAEAFVTGWKQSPEHRKNMLDPDVTETGVGVAHSEESGAYFAVQLFGRPKSKSLQFQITNQSDQSVRYKVVAKDSQRAFSLPPRVTRTHARCRPSQLDFTLAGRDASLKPSDGSHYVVVEKASGELDVQKQ
jgi:uncharacterized protein YkwD